MKTIEQRISDLETELAQLKAAAQAEAWPNMGDQYWYVNSIGRVASGVFGSRDGSGRLLTIGDIYRTQDEAVREVVRRQVLAELRQLAKASGECDWTNPNTDKCSCYFNLSSRKWSTAYSTSSQDLGGIYFSSKEAAENAIKTIGEDRMMLLLEDCLTR